MTESGRVALVTGAARGIGAATAAALAREGATVVLLDRDVAAAEARADDLRSSGLQALARSGDVGSDASCRAALEAIGEEFGRLDVLVNNAAVGVFDATLESLTEDRWDEVLSVNLKSVFLLCRHAVPLMRRTGGGSIVNVASVHAVATTPGVLPYAAAKGGVVALTRALALELAADRIRVVAVLPGAVATPMLRAHLDEAERRGEELEFADDPGEIGRIGDPAEVAEAIAFLASPKASFITGAALSVDGGLLARL